MPYVGTGLVSNFASTFRDNFTGDGSTTSFTLSRNAHHENDLEVFVGNVRQQPGSAYTVSGTTLAFTGTPANGEVIYVVHQAGALQTVQAPTDHGARDFNITGDANKITFGDDSEITVTHVADSGLALKNTNTGDDKPFTLVLQTGETDMAANDVIGAINFQAPDEGTGTDAILVAAGIAAVSEGDFSSSSNATKLSFKTAASAAAAETMSLSSGGNLTVSGNVSVGGDLDVTGSFDMSDANITNVGSIALDSISGDADSNTSITFSGSDVITFATGGSTSFTANANQTVTFSAAVSGTSADFDGGVTIDNFTIDGTEIDLSSGDLTVDVAGDIILDADGGEVLFHDATTAIGHVSMASSNLTIKSLVSDKDIIFQGNDGGAGITALTLDMSASGAATFNSSVTLGGGLIIPDGGDIGSASDLNAIGISSGGVVSITATTASTNSTTGALTVGGGAGIAADLSVGDDLRLISDSAVLSFGADNDITLTHNADTGLTLNGKLVATELDISGNIDVDGTTNLDALDVDGATNFALDVTFADGSDIITASAGTSNTRIGVNAGNTIASGGNYNVVIGDEAGTALTTGDNNVAIGFEALSTEDAHGLNVAIGFRSLKTLDAGADGENTAVGNNTGTAMTTAIYNTVVGSQAGDALTDGSSNTAIGMNALTADTSGQNSVAIGRNALLAQNFTSSTDAYNVAIGRDAGLAVTTGTENTIVGAQAGDAMTDADRNTAVGYLALTTNTKSDRNTAIGRSALENLNHTSVTSGLNTAIGHGAGSVITTGEKNTIIGSYSGNQSSLDIRTADNNIVLSDGDGEAQLCINGNGVISVGGIKTPTSTDATLNISQHGGGFPLLCHRTGTGDGVQVSFHNDNNQVGRINTSGSGTSYVTSSDYRLKENVTTSWDATTRLKQLKPSRFNFKTDADTTVDGFLAHEVSSIVPEAITGEKDAVDSDGNPDYQGIDHSKLVPLLVKTLQEALTKIETLESKVTALEG